MSRGLVFGLRPDDVRRAVMRTAQDGSGRTRPMRLNVKRSAAVLGAAVATALIGPAAGAQAALVDVSACDGAQLTKPFQRWRDTADYKLAPSGDFEGALSGWTLSGAAKK